MRSERPRASRSRTRTQRIHGIPGTPVKSVSNLACHPDVSGTLGTPPVPISLVFPNLGASDDDEQRIMDAQETPGVCHGPLSISHVAFRNIPAQSHLSCISTGAKYLETVQPHLASEEFERTQSVVKSFVQ